MAITKASAQTTVNSGVTAAAAATINQITTAPASATVVAGGGTLGGVTISNVAIMSNAFANASVLSGDTAVSSAGGFVRITGTGFKTAANVLLGSTALANTFVSSTQINATIPATAVGNYQFTVFNTDGSGAILSTGLSISGPPSWTTTTYSSNSLTLGIQLLASGDAPLTYYIQPGSANPQNLTVNSAGYLSGTVSAEGSYTVTVVVDDAQGQSTQADITTIINLTDPYFNLTTLLLPADTSANVWITDASTNNFALTVNGDTRPSAFSPYDTVWSNYFDGSGDYLTVPANAAFNFGTDDYTIEGWINVTTTTWTLYATGGSGSSDQFVCDSGTLYWGFGGSFGGGTASYFTSADLNTWTHVAVSRSSGTTRIFKNGLVMATSATVAAIGSSVNTLQIGRRSDGFYFTTGWMSNIRVLKGTGLYTGAFTPSNTPLTAIANTSLLTCQSNRFIDSSTNNFAITRNGDVSVSNFAPFVETDTTTGSGYFDGTGDYLSLPNNVALDFGLGDFTIECWVYPTSLPNTFQCIVITCDNNGGSGGIGIFARSTGEIQVYEFVSNSAIFDTTGFGLTRNQWTHIAVTRSGSTNTLYKNGVVFATTTNSANYNSSTNTVIGDSTADPQNFYGYISDLRILKGTALAPTITSPLTAIANTSLLTLQYRTGENNNRFVDTSGLNNIITRNGNTTQGTYSPFSQTGWSNYFDGTGDFLSLADNAALNPGTSDFVMEAWVYITALTGNNQGFNGKGTAGTDGYSFFMTNARVLSFVWNGTGGATITGGTLNLNQWHHIAVVRNNNVIRLYLDGTGAGSSTACTTDITSTATKFVGQARGGNPILGYMSNYRMIKGSRPATYDATSLSLTVPTSPFTAISGTSLLTCQSNRFIDNSTNNFAITRNGDVSVQAFSPFAPAAEYSAAAVGGSAYFDGTGDFLSIANNSGLKLTDGDWTIDFWMYCTGAQASSNNAIWTQDNTGGFTGIIITANNSRQVQFTSSQTGSGWTYLFQTFGTYKDNTWHHVALTKSGSTVRGFFDGVVGLTINGFPATIFSSTDASVMGVYAGSAFFNGYISNFRIVKGTAVYTAAFTPPAAPPTLIINTSLLLNFTNAGITDATARNIFETVGDAKISTAQKKFGGSSMFFDGTGDYLVTPSSPLNILGSGNFTVEFWAYPNNTSSTYRALVASENYAGTTGGWSIYQNGTSIEVWLTAGQLINATSALTATTWQHVALSRASGTVRLFVNGTSIASASNTAEWTGQRIFIGDNNYAGTDFFYIGYLDDLRITKGFARYTANFTPPTDTFKLR